MYYVCTKSLVKLKRHIMLQIMYWYFLRKKTLRTRVRKIHKKKIQSSPFALIQLYIEMNEFCLSFTYKSAYYSCIPYNLNLRSRRLNTILRADSSKSNDQFSKRDLILNQKKKTWTVITDIITFFRWVTESKLFMPEFC